MVYPEFVKDRHGLEEEGLRAANHGVILPRSSKWHSPKVCHKRNLSLLAEL